MCRLFGYAGNDPSLLGQAFEAASDALVEDCDVPGEGWGMGYYQDDRPLVRKRPKILMERVEFASLMQDVRSRSVVGQLRRGSRGEVSPENTPPFRFRNWLFANQGEIAFDDAAHAALRDRLPDFLRRNVRGQTDAEPALHLMFDHLRQHTQVENPRPPLEALAGSVRAALSEIKSLLVAAGQERPPEFNLIYQTGRMMVVVQHQSQVPLAYRRVEGLTESEAPLFAGHAPRVTEHAHFRGLFVAFDPYGDAEDWTKVPAGSLMVIDDKLKVHVQPLEDASA